MNTITIRFLPSGKTVAAHIGDNLLQIALDAGVHINASCGGSGTCGKCKVIVQEGELSHEASALLSDDEYQSGIRLACRAALTNDVTVAVPSGSLKDIAGAPVPRSVPHAARRISQQFAEEVMRAASDPPARKVHLKLSPPRSDDNISDMERVRRGLRRDYGIRDVQFGLPLVKQLPRLLRASKFTVTGALVDDGCMRITALESGDTTSTQCALALDIGTTSLWGRLIDITSKRILTEASAYNPQIPYGDDIISRIIFSQRQDGLAKLQTAISSGVLQLINELLAATGRTAYDIAYIAAAGNTVMTHTLLGIDPTYIREAPYVPAANTMPLVTGADLGWNIVGHAPVRCLPCPASYVGGDIVAGVLSSGMHRSNALTLYIDIGTNGEIVLGNKDWLMAAACSAGPAFEGGGLCCGMRAVPGAIEGFSIDDETLEPMVVTIDRAVAQGICGSGAINILAECMRTGLVDRSGRLNDIRDSKRMRRTDNGLEYVLVFAEDTGAPHDIVLREADIENLIRAKAAMFAGYHCLLEKAGLGFHDIEQVIIAGAFGDYIDVEKAIAIGLLPDIPRERYVFIGNGSLLGAQLVSLSRALLDEAMSIAGKITTIELSDDRSFTDKYIAGLFLPHTHIDLFPTVRAWIGAS
ncbi:MAG: ASKHA domain-containing protein [Desulfobacterota bacterium]|nr:ASKHA domain-containing protein [Thermodesulfobacteriota bacterium]